MSDNKEKPSLEFEINSNEFTKKHIINFMKKDREFFIIQASNHMAKFHMTEEKWNKIQHVAEKYENWKCNIGGEFYKDKEGYLVVENTVLNFNLRETKKFGV